MRHTMLAGAMVLSVLSAGCATKKYVAQTVAPVETHVASVESKNDAKNADQDKIIAGQGQQIQDLDRSLSQTKEKLTDILTPPMPRPSRPGSRRSRPTRRRRMPTRRPGGRSNPPMARGPSPIRA